MVTVRRMAQGVSSASHCKKELFPAIRAEVGYVAINFVRIAKTMLGGLLVAYWLKAHSFPFVSHACRGAHLI